MKKITILLLLTALIACNKNTNWETKNRKVIWADNVQSIVPFPFLAKVIKDTIWNYNKEQIFSLLTNTAFKYDKEKIFSSITEAVLSGKLKAYNHHPDKELTIKEFNSILVTSDTTQADDPSNPGGALINAIVTRELTSDDVTQIKFDETIEFDTLNYSLTKKVSAITFFTYNQTESHEIIYDGSNRELFYVKLNDVSKIERQK